MPGFKGVLTDTQLWQMALLVANADKLPDSAKKLLAPDPIPASPLMQVPDVAPVRGTASKK
jgi:hypothetical protein